jgi:hypothetical protein
MPDILWPATLQQKLNVADFNFKIGSTSISSENDVGPAKKRRRSTKSIDLYSCSINLDFDEYQDFYDFFNVELNGGVEQFVFDNPFTEVPSYFRMVGEPSIRPLGGRVFSVSMSWELIADV